jgi:hypothetical protein
MIGGMERTGRWNSQACFKELFRRLSLGFGENREKLMKKTSGTLADIRTVPRNTNQMRYGVM